MLSCSKLTSCARAVRGHPWGHEGMKVLSIPPPPQVADCHCGRCFPCVCVKQQQCHGVSHGYIKNQGVILKQQNIPLSAFWKQFHFLHELNHRLNFYHSLITNVIGVHMNVWYISLLNCEAHWVILGCSKHYLNCEISTCGIKLCHYVIGFIKSFEVWGQENWFFMCDASGSSETLVEQCCTHKKMPTCGNNIMPTLCHILHAIFYTQSQYSSYSQDTQ